MIRKNLAVSAIVVPVSFITLIAFFIETCMTLQSINPAAALAAITVAVIGMLWFKKQTNLKAY